MNALDLAIPLVRKLRGLGNEEKGVVNLRKAVSTTAATSSKSAASRGKNLGENRQI